MRGIGKNIIKFIIYLHSIRYIDHAFRYSSVSAEIEFVL